MPDSTNSNAEPPVDPPSLMSMDDASRAANQGRAIKLTEPNASAVSLPAKLRKLRELAENAELTGSAAIFRGAIMVSLGECQDVEKILVKAIGDLADLPFNHTDETDEEGRPVGPTAGEALAQTTNAYASVLKAKAALLKVSGEAGGNPRQEKKGRRSFAKGMPIGPVIDAKPA